MTIEHFVVGVLQVILSYFVTDFIHILFDLKLLLLLSISFLNQLLFCHICLIGCIVIYYWVSLHFNFFFFVLLFCGGQ